MQATFPLIVQQGSHPSRGKDGVQKKKSLVQACVDCIYGVLYLLSSSSCNKSHKGPSDVVVENQTTSQVPHATKVVDDLQMRQQKTKALQKEKMQSGLTGGEK